MFCNPCSPSPSTSHHHQYHDDDETSTQNHDSSNHMFRSPRSWPWSPKSVISEPDYNDTTATSSPFGKDALAHTRDFTAPEDTTESVYHDTSMSPAAVAPEASVEHKDMDAAEKVYETAKGIWAWGKGVIVVKTFLGIAEGVAGKAVSVVGGGATLKDVDDGVTKKLELVDEKYLNPAIAALVAVLMGAVGKSEEILKPIITTLLKPVGLLKNTSENPELTTSKPALTTAK